MKVCIPTETDEGLEAPVCAHFGRAPHFTVVDLETDAVSGFPNQGKHHGGAMTPAELVAEAEVDVLLVGGLGPRAVRILGERDVEVFTGATGTVRDALSAYRAESLARATEDTACKDHHHG